MHSFNSLCHCSKLILILNILIKLFKFFLFWLVRYRELYSDEREKDYTEAERYYERAAFLVPVAGNPQNQVEKSILN
jgi:Zn-dependent protease with chaperone function